MKLLTRIYKMISGWLRTAQVPGFAYTTCKFYPSCSEYAELAIERHGHLKGSVKAFVRVVRCNPLSAGGIDYP
ncbi:MAG: membrane protein insertion efficiency factor YidD [Patescibacteria group bacterium]